MDKTKLQAIAARRLNKVRRATAKAHTVDGRIVTLNPGAVVAAIGEEVTAQITSHYLTTTLLLGRINHAGRVVEVQLRVTRDKDDFMGPEYNKRLVTFSKQA